MIRLIFAFIVSASILLGQDAELSNNRSDAQLVFGVGDGSDKGTAYAEEYLFYNKTVWDQKVVYIKDDTNISMSVRSGSLMAGKPIIYKTDRDLNFAVVWQTGAGGAHVSTYSAPFAFEDLTYEDASPVVGTTGAKSGIAWNALTKNTYYWRGSLDSVGDEWHTLNTCIDTQSTDKEYRAMHGKMFMFVVNPKTPCLTVRVTGNGQFYTTPPKMYFLPKIHDQTTYFQDAVTFELRDINGNNVWYKINGGSWIDAGANNVTLDQDDFTAGTNTLQYYYAGNSAYTKTRTIVKDPAFPSAGETHGELLWGSGNTLYSRFQSNKVNPGVITMSWYGLCKTSSSFNQTVSTWAVNGLRPSYLTPNNEIKPVVNLGVKGHHLCAFVAHEEGLSATRSGSGKTYAQFSKEFLLCNLNRIDPVGIEQRSSGPAIPSREIKDRGYDVVGGNGRWLEAILAYDLMIDIYSSDDHASGITPIEDYYLRDCFARWNMWQMMEIGQFTNTPDTDTKMWQRCQWIAAQLITLAMPDYSTPYYGTSGWGGSTTTYDDCPFPDDAYTWKQVFIDEVNTATAYPNAALRVEYDNLFTDTGTTAGSPPITIDRAWADKIEYSKQGGAGMAFGILAMMSKIHTGVDYPKMFTVIERGKKEELYAAKKDPADPISSYGPDYIENSYVVNEFLAENTDEFIAFKHEDPAKLHNVFKYGFAPAVIYFDPTTVQNNVGDVTAPTLVSATFVTTGDAIDLVFSEPVVGVAAAHYSLSGGFSLGTATGSATTWSMPISPAITQDGSATISYTSGASRTADNAGNLMASITNAATINESDVLTPIADRPARRGLGMSGAAGAAR